MLISHSHRFIFIHVGKTGGMSMREVLQSYSEEPERFKMRRPPKMAGDKPNPLYTVWETLLLHAKARDVKKELPAETYNSYFKFAFVRNPWDLLVSLYHFILREPDAAKHDQVAALSGFDEFVDWVVATPDPFPRGITKLQADMVTDGQGNLIVDFLGRYERLNDDFDYIARTVGITASLPHLNKSKHTDYRDYYNERTRQLVADHFRSDIELLGYTFDGYRSLARSGGAHGG